MKRHFQIHIGTKSFLTFTMIISAVMLVYAAISLYYITGNARKTYLKSADYECGAIADDLGKLYDEINQMTTFLLSEPDVLAAIQYTSKESEGQNSILENRYLSDIRAGLSSYYITKYYYRVSYLNRNGVFVTSSQWISNYSEKEQIQEILQEQFGDEMGKTVEFWGTYSDPWAKQNPEQVVGFVKKISGNQRGFFEVQIEEARFRELFQREFPSRTVLMASLDGERIYQGADGELPDSGGELSDSGGELLDLDGELSDSGGELSDSDRELLDLDGELSDSDGGLLDSDGELSDSDEELAETFWNLAAEMEAGASMSVQDGFVGGTLLTCREYETALGTLRIICAVPQFELIKDVMWLYVSIIILMVILAVLTFVFLKTYTRRLVVPIQDLKERMDQTGIQNLEELSGLTDDKNELEEITALKKGYNRLIARIKEGMLREKKLESLQVQANLDTLQAQINPHFINNTLSVISYRGTLLGDDEICEVCNSLSAMMKFSANTKKRIVTVREELDYVEAYMQLLKYRHQDKFEYRIQVEKELYPQRLPKVVIQQLVENSMSHGYRTPHEKMTVEVTGWVQDGWWYIQVCDNGDGFDESVLERLRTEMERVRREILDEHRIQEMEIGGMGIMNIYSRMLLLHSQNFRLEIENMEAGAKVVLCSVMEEELE